MSLHRSRGSSLCACMSECFCVFEICKLYVSFANEMQALLTEI